MRQSRFSIARLMALVAIVGANIAYIQALDPARDDERIVLGAPIGLILQLGLWQLVRRRGEGRAFWLGFLIGGSLACLTLLWDCYGSHASWTETFWGNYIEGLHLHRYRRPWIWPGYNSSHSLRMLVGTLYVALPHLQAALVGGAIARRVYRGLASHPRSRPLSVNPA